VLAALDKECTRATFFLIGREAAAQAALVKDMAARGHTIAHHSYSHPNMSHVTHDAALRDIDRGFAADEAALHGRETGVPSVPFFRFPYFESTPALLDDLQKRRIAVFGADFWASDWNPMTPAEQLQLIVSRLEEARRGIILFHDTKGQTAAMLPDFLRYLRTHDYRVVHLVPAQPSQPAAPTSLAR
jgi:peptidoglycan/xylan/chitin deacetylase (PgdA/CDA1 family)